MRVLLRRAIGLSGEKLNSFTNPRELEVAIRGGTEGESWVDDVQEGMKAMMTAEAAAAAPVIAMSEEAKAATASAQTKFHEAGMAGDAPPGPEGGSYGSPHGGPGGGGGGGGPNEGFENFGSQQGGGQRQGDYGSFGGNQGGGGYGGGGGGGYGGGGGGGGGPVDPSTGHDYSRAVRSTLVANPINTLAADGLSLCVQDDGAVQVDEPRVNAMLAERMQAKMARDFGTADRLRDELRSMGIEVFDRERTWKAGGGGGGGY